MVLVGTTGWYFNTIIKMYISLVVFSLVKVILTTSLAPKWMMVMSVVYY